MHDFGDLTIARTYGAIGQASSFTRAIFAGGVTPTYRSTIDYVNFSTTGNAAFLETLQLMQGIWRLIQIT